MNNRFHLNLSSWLRCSVAAVALVGIAGAAQGANVTFSNIIDGDGSPLLFDVGATAPDPADGNKLIIGLNNFTANGASIATASAIDTLSMTIDAPAGFFITSVGFTDGGSGQTTNGVASVSGSLVADNIATNFLTQLFPPNANSSWTITPAATTINNKTSIGVSITNSLFAFSFTPNDTARIDKTSAMLTVGITPIPEPGALALLIVGLPAILLIRRTRLSL